MSTYAVKICGLGRYEDVQLSLFLGANLLGFNFWPGSKRFIEPSEAAPLVSGVPSDVTTVGVFVDASPEQVAAAVKISGVKAVQLHGDEDDSLYGSVGAEVIPVVRVKDAASIEALGSPPPFVKRVLLDTHVEGYGGGGVPFDWSLVALAKKKLGLPLLLAGGLTPTNVEEALRRADPWGVDVASGVEASPRIKDANKVKAFIDAVRRAEKRGQATFS